MAFRLMDNHIDRVIREFEKYHRDFNGIPKTVHHVNLFTGKADSFVTNVGSPTLINLYAIRKHLRIRKKIFEECEQVYCLNHKKDKAYYDYVKARNLYLQDVSCYNSILSCKPKAIGKNYIYEYRPRCVSFLNDRPTYFNGLENCSANMLAASQLTENVSKTLSSYSYFNPIL